MIIKIDDNTFINYENGEADVLYKDIVTQEISQRENEVSDLDILNDDKKLLSWAKKHYPLASEASVLAGSKNRLKKLQDLLKEMN